MRSTLGFARRHGIAVTALFFALGASAYAATTGAFVSSNGTISACVKSRSGAVVLVKPGAKCHKGRQLVTWNQQGVQGHAGATGATGAAGATGASGANGSSAGLNDLNDGPVNITVNGEQPVATMPNVPAGNYIITAKAQISNGATPVFIDCFLRAGTDFDESRSELTATAVETLPFTVSHTFATPGSVTLTCNGFGVSYSVASAKISAVSVQALTRTTG